MTASITKDEVSGNAALTITRGSYGSLPFASSGHLPCSQQAVVP